MKEKTMGMVNVDDVAQFLQRRQIGNQQIGSVRKKRVYLENKEFKMTDGMYPAFSRLKTIRKENEES
jgi:hypothetical protein